MQRHDCPGGRRSGQHRPKPVELLRPDPPEDLAGDQAVEGDDADTAALAGRSASVGRCRTADVLAVAVAVAGAQDRRERFSGVVVPDAPGLGGAVSAAEGVDQIEGIGVALAGAVIGDVAADENQVDVGQAPAVVQQLRQNSPSVDTLGVGAQVPWDVQVRQVQEAHVVLRGWAQLAYSPLRDDWVRVVDAAVPRFLRSTLTPLRLGDAWRAARTPAEPADHALQPSGATVSERMAAWHAYRAALLRAIAPGWTLRPDRPAPGHARGA